MLFMGNSHGLDKTSERNSQAWFHQRQRTLDPKQTPQDAQIGFPDPLGECSTGVTSEHVTSLDDLLFYGMPFPPGYNCDSSLVLKPSWKSRWKRSTQFSEICDCNSLKWPQGGNTATGLKVVALNGRGNKQQSRTSENLNLFVGEVDQFVNEPYKLNNIQAWKLQSAQLRTSGWIHSTAGCSQRWWPLGMRFKSRSIILKRIIVVASEYPNLKTMARPGTIYWTLWSHTS